MGEIVGTKIGVGYVGSFQKENCLEGGSSTLWDRQIVGGQIKC